MKKSIKNKRGFSMAEVVISASILIIMTTGIFLVLGNSIMHSSDSRNTIIAAELAQEGIELVRNIRDNNMAKEVAYDTNLVGGTNYRIDKNYAYGGGIPIDSDFRLKYNSDNFYEHTTGADTKFARRIIIGSVTNGIKITSVVSWDGNTPPINPWASCVGNKCVYTDLILMDR